MRPLPRVRLAVEPFEDRLTPSGLAAVDPLTAESLLDPASTGGVLSDPISGQPSRPAATHASLPSPEVSSGGLGGGAASGTAAAAPASNSATKTMAASLARPSPALPASGLQALVTPSPVAPSAASLRTPASNGLSPAPVGTSTATFQAASAQPQTAATSTLTTTKAPATGIFSLLEPATGGTTDLQELEASPSWTNPNVAGVAVRPRWGTLEPASGQFDWTYLDQAVKLAAQYHKRLSITVAGGIFTPSWVYQAGAQPFTFTDINTGTLETMPLPWDPVYVSAWSAFVRALGQRYDGSPFVAYVTIGGPGREIETFCVDTAQDVSRFDALGGDTKWLAAAEGFVNVYAHAFPHTPFILATGVPTPDTAGHDALQALVAYGTSHYPVRFGIMSDSLTPGTGGQWVDTEIQTLSATTSVGFQMLIPSSKFVSGTLQDALNVALTYRAHFVEVYEVDCDNPLQATGVAQAEQALLAS